MFDSIKRAYNWLRIRLRWILTDNVQRYDIRDEKGKDHQIWLDKKVTDVCQHNHIERIDNIFWKCMDCDDTYFVITYFVEAKRNDVISHIETIANHFKATLTEDPYANERKQQNADEAGEQQERTTPTGSNAEEQGHIGEPVVGNSQATGEDKPKKDKQARQERPSKR